jgi:hypothetical protein
MFKNFHTTALAAAAGAGLLMVSVSPSLACIWVATNPSCTESAPQVTRHGALYDVAPGGSMINSQSHRSRQHAPAGANAK